MLGAITGDTIGSRFVFRSIKSTSFELFDPECRFSFTDDTVMTIAVADWLMEDPKHTHEVLEENMVYYAKVFPEIDYGGMFFKWLFSPNNLNPEGIRKPYYSFGNGSAMRVSAVGWMFDTLEETERVAEISASITHNHPEGIKGAQATAAAIYMARNGKSKKEIKNYITTKFDYDLNRTCNEIRPYYDYNETCQGSVPEAIIAFLDSHDYESAIRLAVSLGGASDTQACIAGGIAEAYYGMPDVIIKEMVDNHLPFGYLVKLFLLGRRPAYRCHLEHIKRCCGI